MNIIYQNYIQIFDFLKNNGNKDILKSLSRYVFKFCKTSGSIWGLKKNKQSWTLPLDPSAWRAYIIWRAGNPLRKSQENLNTLRVDKG